MSEVKRVGRQPTSTEIEDAIYDVKIASAAAIARQEVIVDATIRAAFQVQGMQIESISEPDDKIGASEFAQICLDVALGLITDQVGAKIKAAIKGGLRAQAEAALGEVSASSLGSVDLFQKFGAEVIKKEADAVIKQGKRLALSALSDTPQSRSRGQSLAVVVVIEAAQNQKRQREAGIRAIEASFERSARAGFLDASQLATASRRDPQNVSDEELADYGATLALLQEAAMWAYKYEFGRGTEFHADGRWFGGPHYDGLLNVVPEKITTYWLDRFAPLFERKDFKRYFDPRRRYADFDAHEKSVPVSAFLEEVGRKLGSSLVVIQH